MAMVRVAVVAMVSKVMRISMVAIAISVARLSRSSRFGFGRPFAVEVAVMMAVGMAVGMTVVPVAQVVTIVSVAGLGGSRSSRLRFC